MMKAAFRFLFLTLINVVSYAEPDGSPYSLIDAVQTECEYQGLTWGSRLADAWNSYDESIPFKQRFGHEYFYQSGSFAKMLHFEMVHRAADFEGVPLHHKHSTHKQGKHRGAAPFQPLNNKWIYFLGDSTLYPIWNSINRPLRAHEASLESAGAISTVHTEECASYTALSPRKTSSSIHLSIKDHTDGHRIADHEACHVKGFGPNSKLSYERRDLLIEDYPQELDFFSFHPIFGLNATSTSSVPDVLVIQIAYHTCSLSLLKSFKDSDNWLKNTESNLSRLMRHLQELKQRHLVQHQRPLNVILSLPGRSLYNSTTINVKVYDSEELTPLYDYLDYCLWKLNGMMMYTAHLHHIPTLWREEIEHRLLLRTEHFYGTQDMNAVSHNQDIEVEHVHLRNRERSQQLVHFPGSQIVAASLIEMLHCFDRNQTFVL